MLVAAAIAASVFLFASEARNWSPLFWSVLVVPLGFVLLDPAVLGRASNWLLARMGRPGTLIPLGRGQVAALLAWFSLTMGLLAVGTGLGIRAVAGGQAGSVAFIGLGFLLAWVVSMLAFVFPSGLGVREGAFAVVLTRYLPSSAAVSLAAASRLLLTAVELAVVAVLVGIGRTQDSPNAGRASSPPSPSVPLDRAAASSRGD
jgi:hypothetical protein